MKIKYNSYLDNELAFAEISGDLSIRIKHLTEQVSLSLGNDTFKYGLNKTKLTINSHVFNFRQEISNRKEKKLYNLMKELNKKDIAVVFVEVVSVKEGVDVNIEMKEFCDSITNV